MDVCKPLPVTRNSALAPAVGSESTPAVAATESAAAATVAAASFLITSGVGAGRSAASTAK